MQNINVNRKNIWQFEQNKPSLIVEDLQKLGVPQNIAYKILLARGVFKWFAVRRNLIKLKNIWKDRIKNTIENIHEAKKSRNTLQLMYLRGYLKAYEECRKEIRELCHSERWQAPDNDKKAINFLKKLDIMEG